MPLCLALVHLHVPRDVFDHDDGVVDDETGRERQAEERDRVDREPEDLHDEERADQRDRNRHRRNQRRLRVLQENVDDEHDQQDREQQRDDDFLDRLRARKSSCRMRPCSDARRELLRRAASILAMHAVGDLQRVCGRILQYAQADDLRVAVETQRGRVVLRAEFDARHVAQAREAAVGIRAQNDVRELLRVGELGKGVDRIGVRLVVRLRRRTDAAGGDLGVLLLQRGDDVAGVEALLLAA